MNRISKHRLSIAGYVLILLVISRALLYLTGFLGVNLFSQYTLVPEYETVTTSYGQTYSFMKLPEKLKDTHRISIGDLRKFDSYWYERIAETGYDRVSIKTPHPPANWVFFPLYPLTVAWFAKLTTLSTLVSGIVLSHFYLWIALFLIYLIGLERGLSDREAKTVLFFIVMFPSSVYYSLMYTESLFLMLSAATIYLAMRKHFAVALLVAGLSTVTRVPGIANLLYAGGSLLLYKGFHYKKRDLRYLLVAGLSLLPLLAYFGYMKKLTGDFLAPIHEQENWARESSIPFANVINYLDNPYFILNGGWDNGFISFVLSAFILLVFVSAFFLVVKKVRSNPETLLFFLYGAMLIVIPFSSSEHYLTSVVRYMMVSLPLYFYLQMLTKRHELFGKTAIGIFAVFQAVITIAFFNDYFFVV